ncbi:type I-E CRISPR-associated protein Cse1/CasA [Nonomuraea sp. MCN248]|uniref:Type I-E CRISPR-associated protein Cse1/CasA n=1 Tax=Nonomuraea corallina TaxID=2989783 RepID=A0ABT4SHD0_9ACTN|nr:type I-E CRISPR-associated protein Cse1/CasA [Nonomuraea corallina]MDA0636627.1 type I-E CRISPR-associated protein Cse1/CasA [Nonomuraea corallina]
MRHGYDLLNRDWIPVRPGSAVGIRELLTRAHELEDIVTPLAPAGAGLWRVLAVFAARLTGLDRPASFDEWESRRESVLDAGRFKADESSYLSRYQDRFDLFDGERPFLQDPRLAEECAKTSGINKLVLSRPAGNNQVWFDHHTDLDARPIPPEEAVWYLLAQLYYGPSGRCTSRTVNGRSEANSTAGPLRGTISFHPLGRTVFESLVVGIPYPGSRPVQDDLAPWERDDLPDPLGLPPPPVGIAGVLTGRFRHAVLLSQKDGLVDNAWITWAWRQPTATVRDPYLIYQENRTGDLYARGARSERALWRDVDALLLHDVGEEHARRPQVLDQAENLPFDLLDDLRVRAFGFDQDGQTRDRQWFTAATPAILSLLKDPQSAMGVSRVRLAAEKVGRHLGSALRSAWVAINDPSNGNGPPVRSDIPAGPWRGQGDARYWPRAEQEFWRKAFSRDFDEPAMDFIKVALQVYEEITEKAGSAPRARRAIERARGLIFAASKPAPSRRADG